MGILIKKWREKKREYGKSPHEELMPSSIYKMRELIKENFLMLFNLSTFMEEKIGTRNIIQLPNLTYLTFYLSSLTRFGNDLTFFISLERNY